MMSDLKLKRALGLGDAMVDLSTEAPAIPPRGGNVWSSAVRMSPGGTVANVAANLGILGVPSSFAGGIGLDPYGEYMLDEFARKGVETGRCVRTEAFTGIVLAIVDAERERTFVACARGAAHTALTEADVTAMDFGGCSLLHTSGVCLTEEPARSAILLGMQRAREAGLKVYYDPNLRLEGDVFPDALKAAQLKALQMADVILIGAEELALIYPSQGDGALQELHEAGAELIVVKQGAHGLCAYPACGEPISLPAFPVTTRDTTGAGDAFDAGFIAANLRGMDLRTSLRYASAVAALNVTRIGSQTLPSHEEVLLFLEQQ